VKQKTCQTCRQPLRERPIVEDKSCNGVTVIKYRFKDGSTYVDTHCQCFGHAGRVHSNEKCPQLLRARKRRSVSA
jgi:hypothetical protein